MPAKFPQPRGPLSSYSKGAHILQANRSDRRELNMKRIRGDHAAYFSQTTSTIQIQIWACMIVSSSGADAALTSSISHGQGFLDLQPDRTSNSTHTQGCQSDPCRERQSSCLLHGLAETAECSGGNVAMVRMQSSRYVHQDGSEKPLSGLLEPE